MSDRAAKPSAQVTALGGGRYAVESSQGRRVAYAVHAGNATWVFLDGRVHLVPDSGAQEEAGHTDEAALSTPMPATIVAIEVSEGQQVSRGDTLIRLEAMKMELAIKAPRNGTVAAILCRTGEFVQPGALLVELSPRA